jgi:hypothetical protein
MKLKSKAVIELIFCNYLFFNFVQQNFIEMKGISFITNEKNQKIAVQIDLEEHSEIWEDFYDCLIAEERKNEETISLNILKEELLNEGYL